MSLSDELKDFEDPLMGRVSSAKNGGQKKSFNGNGNDPGNSRQGGGLLKWFAAVALLLVVGTGGYLLYQAQVQLEKLDVSLTQSQQHLQEVSGQLADSQEKLKELEGGLGDSQKKIGSQQSELSRYKQLYTDLQSKQTDQNKELEAISIRKADQSAVDQLSTRTEGIAGQVGDLDSKLTQTNSSVSDLREQTTQNRSDLDATRGSLDQVKTVADANAREIGEVRRSLEREYYNFELQKGDGVMKVFNVALSLKKIDFKKQRYNIEILSEGKKMQKKDQAVNEPILFYVEGQKKAYELVVNKVDQKYVVGYLSVPKT